MGDPHTTTRKPGLNTIEPNQENTNSRAKSRQPSAAWQTPAGVTKANWEYAQATHISTGYDEFLAGDPLASFDRQILNHYFPDLSNQKTQKTRSSDFYSPIVADFGCGNGRSLIPMLERGYRGLGIDLSIPMLTGFKEKTELANSDGPTLADCSLLQANLVELESLKTDCVDHAISMFSTLGMIQGKSNRLKFLNHARRMIKPGGRFVLHAHNVWFQLRHRGGIRWAISNAFAALRNKNEFGDRTANYRSITNMFIHSFRKNELAHDIKSAGFDKLTWHGIQPDMSSEIESFGNSSSWKDIGWIVACQ